MEARFLKGPITVIAGIAASIFCCVFTFISFLLYPTPYSPINNWLSDLGNSSNNPAGAFFFNSGLILAGITFLPFVFGLNKWYVNKKKWKNRLIATQAVGYLSAFFLIMVGVFSEDYPMQHVFWSATLFIAFGVFVILSGVSLFRHPKFIKLIGIYGFAVVAIDIIFGLICHEYLLEWITSFGFLSYIILITYNMSRKF